MLRRKKQFNINFNIDNDEMPSRFVVDLKEKTVEKEVKKKFDIYDLYEKYEEVLQHATPSNVIKFDA